MSDLRDQAGAGARVLSRFHLHQLWHHSRNNNGQLRRAALWFRSVESGADARIAAVLPDFSSGFLPVRPIIVAVTGLLLRSSGGSTGHRCLAPAEKR